MSDDDGDWKPNGRPQSTLAISFSAALNDAFKMDDYNWPASTLRTDAGDLSKLRLKTSVADLYLQRKQALSTQNQELEALEARLRATEERLKQRQSASNSRSVSPLPPSKASTSGPATRGPPAEPVPEASYPRDAEEDEEYSTTTARSRSYRDKQYSHNQPTARPKVGSHVSERIKSMPGTLPETPDEFDGDDGYVAPRARYTGPKESATVPIESDDE